MKEYWLLLESYVFLWSNASQMVIYNSLSGQGYLFNNTNELKQIIVQLENKENLYCTSINESDFQNASIREFVNFIRENYCGDIFDKSLFPQKPLVVIPDLHIDNEKFRSDEKALFDVNVYKWYVEKNLLELTIYLTGNCTLDCKDCNTACKQIKWCQKNESFLSKETVFELLNQVKYTSLFEVKFLGGNIFQLPYWEELIEELKSYRFKKSFYCDYRLMPTDKKQLEIFEDEDFQLNILVDLSGFKQEVSRDFLEGKDRFCYIFKVSSSEEYEEVCRIIEEEKIEATIFPFYNGNNLLFFEELVFQNTDDILNTPWSKNELFAHKVINTNSFGKFTISSKGEIYDNIYNKPIGTIEDDIKDITIKTLKEGKAWFETRDKVIPCKDCIYKYLCPSPSNYELVLGRNNLCHVKS